MSDVLVVDCRDAVCGRIPSLHQLLATTTAQEVVFLVPPRMVPQMLTALASGADWNVAVEEGLGECRLRFTRRAAQADDPLHLV